MPSLPLLGLRTNTEGLLSLIGMGALFYFSIDVANATGHEGHGQMAGAPVFRGAGELYHELS
jgi:hypothetical protein